MGDATLSVAVLGGGHNAFAIAGQHALAGHRVKLYDVPPFDYGLRAVASNGGIQVQVSQGVNAKSGFASTSVASDMSEAVLGADVVILTVPAAAQSVFLSELAPLLASGQLLLLHPGAFGGALEAQHYLALNGKTGVIIAETETTVWSSARTEHGEVTIKSQKSKVGVGVVPAEAGPVAMRILFGLQAGLRLRKNALTTSFNNINPILHAPILLMNSEGIRTGSGSSVGLYREGFGSAGVTLVEQLDVERMRVATTLELDATKLQELLRCWYPEVPPASDLFSFVKSNPAYATTAIPVTYDHRFFAEDLPFGLVPMAEIARELGLKVPIMTSLIDLLGCLAGCDYWETGRRKSLDNLLSSLESVRTHGNFGTPDGSGDREEESTS